MDVLCVGMYRACSTWQYNLACHLIERYREGQRLGFVVGDHYCPVPGQWRVLKSHDACDTFGAALQSGEAVALYSYRDLRDVAFSLVHKYQSTFEHLIERRLMLRCCLDNDRFWTTRSRVLVQSYDDIVNHPVEAVRELARHLEIDLPPGEAEDLARQYSLEANRSRTSALADELRQQGVNLQQPGNACLFDRQTLLHWNHLRDGRDGAWRDTTTPRQLMYLAAECTPWLLERGYEARADWWQEVVRQRGWDVADLGEAWLGVLRDGDLRRMQDRLEMLERLVDEQGENTEGRRREWNEAREELTRLRTHHGHALNALHHTQGHLALAREQLEAFEQHGETAVAAARRVAQLVGGVRQLYRRWRGDR